MSIRFLSWLSLGIAAAFLIVAQAAFTLPVIAALALGVSIGTLVVSLGVAYGYRTHLPTVVPAVAIALVSVWSIVASRVFSEATVQNLTLADGLAVAGLALVGLIAHEFSTERVVHSFEVAANQQQGELAS
jgi:hypothetical protein